MKNGYKKPELKSLLYDKEVERLQPLNGKTSSITRYVLFSQYFKYNIKFFIL